MKGNQTGIPLWEVWLVSLVSRPMTFYMCGVTERLVCGGGRVGGIYPHGSRNEWSLLHTPTHHITDLFHSCLQKNKESQAGFDRYRQCTLSLTTISDVFPPLWRIFRTTTADWFYATYCRLRFHPPHMTTAVRPERNNEAGALWGAAWHKHDVTDKDHVRALYLPDSEPCVHLLQKPDWGAQPWPPVQNDFPSLVYGNSLGIRSPQKGACNGMPTLLTYTGIWLVQCHGDN